MKQIVLLVCCLFVFSAIRAEEYILEGKVGTYPIVLKLIISEDQAEAVYFYKSNTNDIALNGTFSSGLVKVYTADSSETITLKQCSNKTWTGNWAGGKRKNYLIVLRPANIAAIKHPYSQLRSVKWHKKEDQYAYIRSSGFQLRYDTAIKDDGIYKVQSYYLENSELNAIRIITDTVNKGFEKINRILLDKLFENAEYCKSCISQHAGLSYGYSFSYIITGNLLSAYVSLSLDCAGAMRMSYSDQTFNYDLKTGKELDLDDILYFPGVKNDKELRGNKVLALLKQLYPTKMVNADYCDYADTLAWQNTDWRITENGLLLMPYFVRADLPCWDPDWPVIPFDLLRKYRNPNKKSLLP